MGYGDPPYPPDGPYPPGVGRYWWQNEAATIAVGLLMLLLGGAIGYLIGHQNAKTRIVAATPGHRLVGGVATQTVTVTTSSAPTAGAGQQTITRTRTVTRPARTVTTPAKTVTAPAKVIHATATHTVTRTLTATSTLTTTSTVTASSSSGNAAPQSFNGSGNQTLGTIHVPAASQLQWSCTGCGAGTFSVSNSSSDTSQLAVQGQNATSGQASVVAGTYTNVNVQATGSWSMTLTPQSG